MVKKYTKFLKEEKNQYVEIEGITTKKYGENSIAQLNSAIKNYIEDVYGDFGYQYNSPNNIDIVIKPDLILNSEYISKMVNNYTIFKSVIRNFNLKTEIEFYDFMYDNLNRIYHYNSEYFKKHTIDILMKTSRKGNLIEYNSKNYFKKFIKDQYGYDVEIKEPTKEQDLKGIDGIFEIGGKDYTIQIKPFTDFTKKNNEIEFKSDGSLSVNTNYLILYKDSSNYVFLRNGKKNKIQIKGNKFVANNKNILYSSW